MSYPKFLYHKEHAPDGRIVRVAEEEPTGDGWVDTPAAFDPTYTKPEPLVAEGSVPAAAANAGFVPQRYPTHLYRKGDPESARLVVTAEDHAALEASEPGVWKDSHDATHRSWSDAPALDAPEPIALHAVALSPDQVAEFQKSSVASIVAKLDTVANVDALAALRGAEEANPSGRRATVMKAIEARIKALSVAA